MRQPGLGRLEWIEQEKEKKKPTKKPATKGKK
jgi:DNA-directed RNA polymerase subunit E'